MNAALLAYIESTRSKFSLYLVEDVWVAALQEATFEAQTKRAHGRSPAEAIAGLVALLVE